MAGTPTTGFATNTFAIDNTQRYKVVAQTYCRRIVVQENFSQAVPPTADLLMSAPGPGARYKGTETQVSVPRGTPAIFTPALQDGWFTPNTGAVGDIQTVSGSITVQQVESQQM